MNDTDQTSALHVRLLRSGGESVQIDEWGPRHPGDVLWVDVPWSADVAEVARRLGGLDPRLSSEIVSDLLEPDPLARAIDLGNGLRHVSLIGLHVPEGWREESDCPRHVVFQMIEVVNGPGWIVTCWHRSRHTDGMTNRDEWDEPVLRGVEHAVLQRWETGTLRTAGDVGTALALELTSRYKHTQRALDRWVQDWERLVHGGEVIEQDERDSLKRLLALVNESRRHLAAFNNARSAAHDGRWFADADPELDKLADDALDRTLDRLRMLFDGIRADLDLVCMETLAHQARLAEERASSERKFQEGVGRITALLLVPTLIAGVFGANTWLPGGGTKDGFDVMLLLMVGASTAVYWWIVRQPRKAAETA